MMEQRRERKIRLAEQRAIEKLQKKNAQMMIQAVNNTEGAMGSDIDDAAITKSGLKNAAANKVYPATDCEDKGPNFSQRIAPMTDDEQFQEKKTFGSKITGKDNDAVFGTEQKLGSFADQSYNTAANHGRVNSGVPGMPPPP